MKGHERLSYAANKKKLATTMTDRPTIVKKWWSICIWIGTAPSHEEFCNYLSHIEQFYMASPAQNDLGIQRIGSDLFSTYNTPDGKPVPTSVMLEEIPYSECFTDQALKKCAELGIEEANACFALLDSEFISPPSQKSSSFCGLNFVGNFVFFI